MSGNREELSSRTARVYGFSAMWRDSQTPGGDRERKRLRAVLLEDVTLIKREQC